MPRPPFTRRPAYQKPAPKAADILAAMQAVAPSTEAQARVRAMGARWGVAGKDQPGDRTGPADTGLAGNGNHHGALPGEVVHGQVANRNRARGDAAEARCRRDLRAAGWHINSGRTGSYGAADIIAHRSERVAATDRPSVDTLMVQVKSTIAFKPSMLNAACRDYAQRVPRLAPSIALEVWAWLYGVGWVAVVRLDRDGGVTASGRYAQEVQRSITHTGAWPGL